MGPNFDSGKLLLNCPRACTDGFPICLPSPNPPAPPLLPPPPPSPAAPPYPHKRCIDDVGYRDAGWGCADWAGRVCHGAQSVGVDAELLLFSCPNACADGAPVCFPPSPPTPAPPISPTPPSPPPDLQGCVGYAFEHKVIESVTTALQHRQEVAWLTPTAPEAHLLACSVSPSGLERGVLASCQRILGATVLWHHANFIFEPLTRHSLRCSCSACWPC